MLPQIGVRLRLFNGTAPAANLTGIQALWWDENTVMDADLAVGRSDNLSTDADGWITLNLTHCSLLNAGDTGALLLYRPNALDTRDSELFAGVLAVESLGPGSDSANLISYGMRFDLGYWAKTGIGSVQTGLPSPDGTLTACRLVEDASNGNHAVETPVHTLTALAGGPITQAIWVRPFGNRTQVVLKMYVPGSAGYFAAHIDLVSRTVLHQDGTLSSIAAVVVDAPDAGGWIRIAMTGAFTGYTTGAYKLFLTDGLGDYVYPDNLAYQGDGVSGIDVWGAKLEAGAVATPFVNDSFVGVDMWYHPYDPNDHGWTRPVDWLALPAVVEGEQKFVGLHAVFNLPKNFATVRCDGGAYTVDWGDGTVDNVAAGIIAHHNFDYATFDPTGLTLCSRGYKQSIVTVTPQAGQTLTGFYLNQKHNQAGLASSYASGWLDIEMSAPKLVTLALGTTAIVVRNEMLERFSYIGTNKIALWTAVFAQCLQLQRIPQLYTSWGTSFSQTFLNCHSLRSVPPIDTSRGTTLLGLFQACYSLVQVPPLDTAVATDLGTVYYHNRNLEFPPAIDARQAANISLLYNFCYGVHTVPNLDTPAATNMSVMFSECRELRRLPKLDTSKNTTFLNFASQCYALESVPLLDTSAGTSFNSMLRNCGSLTEVPLFDTSKGTDFLFFVGFCDGLTSVPAFNTSSATILTAMFESCSSLKTAPALDWTNVTAGYQLYQNCSSLREAPAMDTSKLTIFNSMFNGCSSLRKIPALDTALGTTFTNMFGSCFSLQEALVNVGAALSAAVQLGMFNANSSNQRIMMTGAKYSFTVASAQLNAAALNALFTSLGTAAGAQTITVTGNYGTLEAGYDPSIATSKGWTVVA